MVWVDRVVGEIKERFAEKIAMGRPLLIRDEKTLSGRVHVGSLRGVAIHGLIAEVLTEEDIKNEFRFELNDFDPMDDLPMEMRESHSAHMGKPLFAVPPPPGVEAENYPMFYGEEFKKAVEKTGFPVTFYTLRPLYESGAFDETICDVLEHAAKVRAIYKEVSGGGKPDNWYPLSVVCERCGKVGTTQVIGWNPSAGSHLRQGYGGRAGQVEYQCRKDLVRWAEGCGHSGAIIPFGGRAKLPWKVEWAAKWKVLGVDIEGGGKDHYAAGGSRWIAKRVCEEILRYPPPFDIPYEFFNIKGEKMSASKGIGVSAREIADLLPSKILRLLMIRKAPNQPIDFDPTGTTIPALFDEYDRLAGHYFKQQPEPDADYARTFRLTQRESGKKPRDAWHMRFSTVAFVAQVPYLDVGEEAKELKGSPLNAEEQEELRERHAYVRQWLRRYAPERYKFEVLTGPPRHFMLEKEQKEAMRRLHGVLADEALAWEGPAVHEAIHRVKKEVGIPPAKLFEPLYWLFLGRSDGPQVGWFLSTLPRKDVINRIGAIL
jgi:lysyl-tRNA synthetase class 1